MSGRQNMDRDPEKRRAKRLAIREAQKRIGDEALPRKGRTGQGAVAQMDHGSSSKSNKRRREGQARMDAERGQG